MKVKLLSYTPNPELLCAAAARTSLRSKGTSILLENMDVETARKILRRVKRYGHYSVLEHAVFTFSIEGVSRALTHQLVRHRMASYSQQSLRYVKYDAMKHYVTPKSILKDKKAKKVYEDALMADSDAYQKLLECGIPREDARLVLPTSAKTNILVTMNARGLRHFFSLRCCERAQWEIRELAVEMLKQVKRVAPALFEHAGPSCLEFGYCPEKELKPATCKIDEIKKKFMDL